MKIPAKEIKFLWKEGKSSLSREIEMGWHNCTSFAQADEMLATWAIDAPNDGGYDKVAFEVTWEGNSYKGNYHLKGDETPSLGRHIVEELQNARDFSTYPKERKECATALLTLDFGLKEIQEVKVLLCAFGSSKIVTVHVSFTADEILDQKLEKVYEKGQCEFSKDLNHRSLSVNDVIFLDEKKFRIAGFGFEDISKMTIEEYLNSPISKKSI